MGLPLAVSASLAEPDPTASTAESHTYAGPESDADTEAASLQVDRGRLPDVLGCH